MGAKPGLKTVLLGIKDPNLANELGVRGVEFSSGRLRRGTDLVFLGVESFKDLDKLGRCRQHIVSNGVVWVVYPKGQKALTRNDVIAAGEPAGMVDVKIVSFSDTHTGLKFVIPKDQR